MKLLFLGDSITDMGRSRTNCGQAFDYGTGYVFCIAAELFSRGDEEYEILNRGISGDRIVSLYERIKNDVWVEKPDVLTILIGVNDVWHDIDGMNMGVELDRYEKVYRMMIEETRERLPNTKIILMEPFFLKGSATEKMFDEFSAVRTYAKSVKKIAEEYNLYFLPLQEAFDLAQTKCHSEHLLADGVHPNPAGAKLISDEWMKLFDKNRVNMK